MCGYITRTRQFLLVSYKPPWMPGASVIPQHGNVEVTMVEQSTIRTTASCLVAVMMVVGFTAAPAAALTQDSILDDDVVDDIVDTGELDAGTSDSSSETQGVEVRIVETNSPVQTGEPLNVTVAVQSNEGGTAELLIDGESVDQEGFAPGQEDTVNFTWETSFQDAGNHTATVQSGADNDSTTVRVEPGMSAPEAACTDVPGRVNENVPYEMVPSPQEELPEQVPNPVPPFIGPKSAANIVLGVVPNQCEIQDPNDPSIDPTDPPSDPDTTVSVIRAGPYQDGGVLRVYYEATLGESGPSVSGFAGGIATTSGVGADPSVNLDDGAQTYTVDPMVRGDTSTADAATDVDAPFGAAGANADCSAGECQPGTSGIPTFTEYPAVPQPIWTGE